MTVNPILHREQNTENTIPVPVMDSSIEELSVNNKPPSMDIVHKVRHMLLKPLKDIRDLDSEILTLERRLEELRDQRNERQKWMSRYQPILSPIRRVPEDVLGEIFQRCLPAGANPILKDTECPLLLTRVCKVWRVVALSQPRLWSRLHISFTTLWLDRASGPTSRDEELLLRRLDGVKQWLLRAGTRPLSISLYLSTPNRDAEHYRLTLDLLRFLAHLSPRFEDLELSISLTTFHLFESMIDAQRMTKLVSFRITTLSQIWLTHPLSLLNAPNLRKLSIFGGKHTSWGIETPANPAVWSRLTDLSMHMWFSGPETLLFLAHAHNLVHFSLNIDARTHSNYPSISHQLISLPFLRTLFITDSMTTSTRGDLYECIDAPGLKWVMFKYTGSRDDPSLPIPIISLLRRATVLEKLSINPLSMKAWNMRDMFHAVPSITHLFIGSESRLASTMVPRVEQRSLDDGERFDFQLLSSSNVDVDNTVTPPLLPNLESFEINTPYTLINDDDILNFIKSRMAPPPRGGLSAPKLKHVALGFYRRQVNGRDLVEDVRRHAERLGVEMIDLVVGYEKPPMAESKVPEPQYGSMKLEVPTGVEANVDSYIRYSHLE